MLSCSSNQCFLGIDVGTQSVKAALWNESGTQLCSATESVGLLCRDGVTEQSTDEILSAVTKCIRKLLGSGNYEVCAVGLDAQMAGITGIDADGKPVGNYDSWLDARCVASLDLLKSCENDLIEKSGGQLSVSHAPKILFQKEHEPERYRRTAKYVPLSTYLTMRMCGLGAENAYYDHTHLHFNVFSDIIKKTWNTDAVRAFGLDEDKFPAILPPEQKVGVISSEFARATGLKEGTPAVAGCGDTAASAYGAGIVKENMMYDVAGTASVFAASTDKFRPDVKHKTISFALSPVSGLYLPNAYIGGGGLCLRKFKEESGYGYADLDALARRSAAGSGGIVFIPHTAGRTCPFNPNVTGGFYNRTQDNTVGDAYRAILESIAFEYRYFKDVIDECCSGSGNTVYCTGGGADSELFCEIKADVLGVTYVKTRVVDGATLGAAALAARSVGVNASDMIIKAVKYGERTEHNAENTRRYEAFYRRYLRYIDKIEDG